ncbi:apoptosis-antagonizing transcription factor [Fimicolochytrium jonesii]|uniref:apoptosis-antagonizing transcription factor n=1 Tax=Fimicolochytrium jonesii TaxID=1396493 RepID=UPI0022FE7554|nr:apoptosis-antagonizing transcription factor [Fimicolochytrium jonesii]KAI8822550.1 apoptosis-antagonizing transcription factor [Fimicolochytrium jonesii]
MSLLQGLLEDVSSTKPVDYDPEKDAADAFGGNDSDANSADEGEDATEHYVKVGRGRLRDLAGVELDHVKYGGKKVSRNAIFGDEASGSGDEDGSDDGEEEGLSEDGEGLESADGGESASGEDFEEDFGEGGHEDDEEDDEDEVGEDDESDNEEEESEDQSQAEGISHSQARVAKELQQLAAEESKLIKKMSVSAKADVEKGHHVRAQIMLWDNLLDSRIRIQRTVSIANRFPKPDTYPAFYNTASETDRAALAETSDELFNLVDGLISLRTSLISQNPQVAAAVPAAESARKRKRDPSDTTEIQLETLWKQLNPIDTQFKQYRDATIDKWNNKVQMATGALAPLQKKFKSINQSVVSQIRQTVGDKERLIKRSQLRRSDYRCLGEEEKTEEDERAATEGRNGADAHLSNHDAEIFDDGDFYQQLLKELIESRMTDTDDAVLNGLKWAHFKSLKNSSKKKKKVDTRASKGRKIRYHIHEKLTNYMAPQPQGTWHDEMSEELFAGLLGQSASLASGVRQADPVDEIKVSNGVAEDGFRIM